MKKGTIILVIVLGLSLWIASGWENENSKIKDLVHNLLDPSLGLLFEYNVYLGMVIVTALISLLLMLAQKFLTDQETLKAMRKEQKELQKEMKKYKEHPEKLLKLQKQQMEFIPKMMKHTMQPLVFTAIPIILLFRWFSDLLHPVFGGWWFLYYMILAMIFSSIFKKIFDIA